MFFFFKQKTAYEMRISDWSSDVCSSDLRKRVGNESRSKTTECSGDYACQMSDDVTGGTLRDEFRRQSGHSLIRMVFQYWSFVHRASREFVLRTARLALQLPPSCIAVRCCSPESVLSSFHAVKCDQLWSGR